MSGFLFGLFYFKLPALWRSGENAYINSSDSGKAEWRRQKARPVKTGSNPVRAGI